MRGVTMGRKFLTDEEFNKISVALIAATKQLLMKHGINDISIRKIAAEANINSAIIYRHFADLDELIMYACLHIFEEYVTDLIQATKKKPPKNPVDAHLFTWEIFCKHCFQHPKSSYRIFFGKYSENVTDYIKKYYELFPSKLESPQVYKNMLNRGNEYERNITTLAPILQDRKTKEEIELINDINVSYFKHLLSMKIENPSLDNEMLTNRMLDVCKYLIK